MHAVKRAADVAATIGLAVLAAVFLLGPLFAWVPDALATVTTSTRSVTYTGSGTTGPFTVTFPFLSAGDLVVTKTTIATGAEVTLTDGADYRTTLPRGSTQGYITTTSAVASTHTITIERHVAATQTVSLRTQGVYNPVTIENALDKLTMLIIQLLAGAGESAADAVAAHVALADPHTQYALLAGRSGGQHLKGGTASGNSLHLTGNTSGDGKLLLGLNSTSAFLEASDRLGLGTAAPAKSIETTDGVIFDTGGTSSGFTLEDAILGLRADDGLLTLRGGTTSSAGRLRLYGASHATLPGASRLGTDIFTIENESFLSTLATFDIDNSLVTFAGDLTLSSSSPATRSLTFSNSASPTAISHIYGGTTASNSIEIVSTTNGTRGFVYLGDADTTAYDETNDRLGIGDPTPDATLDVAGNALVTGTLSNDTSGQPLSISDSIKYKTCTIAADDTTPSIADCYILDTSSNTGATGIVDLDDAVAGQIVWICIGGNTNRSTIADSGKFNLSAAWAPNSLDDCIQIRVQADDDYIELTRVDN